VRKPGCEVSKGGKKKRTLFKKTKGKKLERKRKPGSEKGKKSQGSPQVQEVGKA